MTRYEAIKKIMDNVQEEEVVISSTGMISRELYQIRDRERNFYMQGSMSFAISIGIGLAYSRPDLEVIVISGDGAALMNMGSLVLHKKLGLSNLTHFILDNNVHATTGGQATCSDSVNFDSLAPNTKTIKVSSERGDAPRIPLSCKQIKDRVYESIRKQE